MEAMRNRIKLNNPILITNSKFNAQQLTSPSTPLFEESNNSPNSGDKSPGFSPFLMSGDIPNHYLKNAFE